MPCSTDDRSHRKYYERVTSIETLDYVGLIAYTVAAINELREMVDELENA
jgi:hypothetical protein